MKVIDILRFNMIYYFSKARRITQEAEEDGLLNR